MNHEAVILLMLAEQRAAIGALQQQITELTAENQQLRAQLAAAAVATPAPTGE